jgi:hypothetical protein
VQPNISVNAAARERAFVHHRPNQQRSAGHLNVAGGFDPPVGNVTRIYFSDFFDVEPEELEEYGAFNVSWWEISLVR